MAIDDNLTERIVSGFVEHGNGIISYEVERWERVMERGESGKHKYEIWRVRIFEKNGRTISNTYVRRVK